MVLGELGHPLGWQVGSPQCAPTLVVDQAWHGHHSRIVRIGPKLSDEFGDGVGDRTLSRCRNSMSLEYRAVSVDDRHSEVGAPEVNGNDGETLRDAH